MQLENFLNKKIIVTQIKGGSKLNDRQKGNLIGLGLRGIGSTANHICSDSIHGMLKKVSHVIKISLA